MQFNVKWVFVIMVMYMWQYLLQFSINIYIKFRTIQCHYYSNLVLIIEDSLICTYIQNKAETKPKVDVRHTSNQIILNKKHSL